MPTDDLERRLREQVADNARLDQEVRYLQAELVVKDEFVAELESQVQRAEEALLRQQELSREHEAYRNRVSHRAVDRTITMVQGWPGVSRLLRRRRPVSAR